MLAHENFWRRVQQRRRDFNDRLDRVVAHKDGRRYREALTDLVELQQINPLSPRVWGHTAEVALLLGDYHAARATAARGLAIVNPDDFPRWSTALLINDGIAAYNLGATADAIHAITEAIGITNVHPVAHLFLSLALERTGDVTRAREHAERAVALFAQDHYRGQDTFVRLALEEVARSSASSASGDPAIIATMSAAPASAILGTLLRSKRPPPLG